jgi:hypothetical protein
VDGSGGARRELRMHVANGHGQRIGRIVGRGHGRQAEQQLHHLLHLRFFGASVPHDGAFDLGRAVLDDREAGLRRSQDSDAARVTELQGAAGIDGVEDAFNGDRVRTALDQSPPAGDEFRTADRETTRRGLRQSRRR